MCVVSVYGVSSCSFVRDGNEVSPVKVGFVTYDRVLHFYNVKVFLITPSIFLYILVYFSSSIFLYTPSITLYVLVYRRLWPSHR